MEKHLIQSMIFLFLFTTNPTLLRAESETDTNRTRGRLALAVGPSLNYFQGSTLDNFDNFNADLINFGADAYLCYMSGSSNHRNSIGVMGKVGYTNNLTMNKIISLENIPNGTIKETNYNLFYQVEAGVVIANALRLSSGIGRQGYTTDAGKDENFEYYSSTAGLLVRIGNVLWNLDANFNYGRDYSQTITSFSTGLMFLF